jgi:DNA-binding transcriptional ArsR family regulator
LFALAAWIAVDALARVLKAAPADRGRSLTKILVRRIVAGMHDVEVIENPAAAAVALDPVRARLLALLIEPSSAAALAARVGIARQKVNYHVRALEAYGLVKLAEERKRGGITERVLRATAASYVVSPAALGETAADPDQTADRLSARYLVALAGRVVREVGSLVRRADAAGKRLPTMTIDTEIRFRSASDRAAFADELTAAVLDLASRYHHDDGRPYRLVVAAHPRPEETP